MTTMKTLRRGARGATMVEYALLIVAVMVMGGYAFRHLGATVLDNARLSKQALETP
jgi:Flp pilus assembly pilin Flp